MDILKLLNKDPFQTVTYRKVEGDYVRTIQVGGEAFLEIETEGLSRLAEEAFEDSSFFLRESHLKQWREILLDPEASENDRYVAEALLRNAVVSAEGLLPLCQDTGTATIIGWKGDRVLTRGKGAPIGRRAETDEEALSRGVEAAYRDRYLRYSQVAPVSLFEEVNTGSNLPAQIDIYAGQGAEYRFLFIAKGGGSANKTSFFQESKALLEPEKLANFLRDKVKALGTAACPPYHLAVVIGGLSPEMNLKVLKLATTGFLDGLPAQGDGRGAPYLDREWSEKLLLFAQEAGLGAQFGGKYLALDARLIRMARHAGSCPVSIGVSCSAHRNVLGRVTAGGVFLEQLEQEPAKYLRQLPPTHAGGRAVFRIDLNQGLESVRKELSHLPVGSLVLLSGPLIVARDIAHARFYQRLREGKGLPDYLYKYGVYYAGPAKTPPGYPIGSFGPTTAQRMDGYLEAFMREGASLLTLAKGNRAKGTAELCRRYGGFYLGTIGGAAAILAKENILSSEVLDYPDLDMEAVRLIQVKDFPAFILIDDKGNDLYGTS